jgi:hypothetical protein
MTNAIVGAIELSVLGGPSAINLDVDFGPTGVRGSRIFGLPADPRLLTTPKPLEVLNYDLGIVIAPSAPDYLQVYQKSGTSLEDWEAFAALYPNLYGVKKELAFDSNGEASFEIIVSDVFTIFTYSVEMFNVLYQIENANPVASSMALNLSTSGTDQILEVTIKAIEYSGSAWTPLQGDKMVDVFSTVV